MQILFTCAHTSLMQVVREFVNSSQKLYAHAQHVLKEIRCLSLRVNVMSGMKGIMKVNILLII